MKQLIVFPRGQLAPKDKERLTKAGFLTVEVEQSLEVRLIGSESLPIGANDMLIAALEAMCSASGDMVVRSEFTRNVLSAIKAKP